MAGNVTWENRLSQCGRNRSTTRRHRRSGRRFSPLFTYVFTRVVGATGLGDTAIGAADVADAGLELSDVRQGQDADKPLVAGQDRQPPHLLLGHVPGDGDGGLLRIAVLHLLRLDLIHLRDWT